MSILDFKEIPKAHEGGGEQDHFELFARDFFQLLGYRIDSDPGRGADGGKDFVLVETRKGIANDTEIRWLVSCKHKAHSGASVLKTDEPEIGDSLRANNCSGFIGFYSTLPSSGLVTKVEGMTEFEHQFFDAMKIEQILLTTPVCLDLAKRYFPQSFKGWSDENPTVAQIFTDHEPFRCHNCNIDFGYDSWAIVTAWSNFAEIEGVQVRKIRNIYVCCGGACDNYLSKKYSVDGYQDKWADLREYFNPVIYIKAIMGFCNELSDTKVEYSAEAFDQQKSILIKAYPYVCRNMTKKEMEEIEDLGMLPKYLGGFEPVN